MARTVQDITYLALNQTEAGPTTASDTGQGGFPKISAPNGSFFVTIQTSATTTTLVPWGRVISIVNTVVP